MLMVTLFSNICRYAIRESNSIVKIFKNFKEKKSFKPDFGAEGNVMYSGIMDLEVLCFHFFSNSIYIPAFTAGIYGGFLLGVRSVNGLAFYDWENTELIRRIEIQPKHVRDRLFFPFLVLFSYVHVQLSICWLFTYLLV